VPPPPVDVPAEAAVPLAAVAPIEAAVAPPVGIGAPAAAAIATETAGNVLPMLASAPAVLAATPPPPLTLPTVPGLPVTLPSEISLPTDLVCEGTAWSVTAPQDQPGAPAEQPMRGPEGSGRADW
ncbi:MAG: hypothetical protein ACSLFA_22545, partial [Mycobacterium sp.]